MISFAQFLTEMPSLLDIDKDSKLSPYEPKFQKKDAMVGATYKKMGEIKGHHVMHAEHGDGHVFKVVEPKTKRTVMQLTTHTRQFEPEMGHVVNDLKGSHNSPVKAHELYHHLVHKKGLTITSDAGQSPGGAKVWQKLHAMSDLKVTHHGNNGSDAPIDADWNKNYDKPGERTWRSFSRFRAQKLSEAVRTPDRAAALVDKIVARQAKNPKEGEGARRRHRGTRMMIPDQEKSPIGGRPFYPQKYNITKTQIPISKIRNTQYVLDQGTVKDLAHHYNPDHEDAAIHVMKHGDNYHVMNGHHRLYANRLRGETHILAHVYDEKGKA